MNEHHNRRQYFRYELNKSMCGDVEIVQIKGQTIQSNTTKVCIEDIGPGGLRFISSLKLPVSNEIVLEFEVKMMDELVKLLGVIVRSQEMGQLFEYGVQFTIFDNVQNQLTQHINSMMIRLRTRANLTSCTFCHLQEGEKCFQTSELREE
ncbi:PilZ domain-containing protein [Brevibacillus sp. SYSU BS000544]|uniref:PilZ domain-containing protein n=1 Tax=Brevibacillus sp. SYSU BS000544 TaxID=3416443 RepID=UPI003CE4D40B